MAKSKSGLRANSNVEARGRGRPVSISTVKTSFEKMVGFGRQSRSADEKVTPGEAVAIAIRALHPNLASSIAAHLVGTPQIASEAVAAEA